MKKKKKPLRYFFFEGDLCKSQHINRPADIITFWNYRKGKLDKAQYSRVKREGEVAFSTRQVKEMLGVGHNTVTYAISRGDIPAPQITYGIDDTRHSYAYYWCEQDIMGFHAYLLTVHMGRPRKDGKITPRKMPTATELRAMIRHGTVFYVKDGDEFIPTWDAEKF